MRTLIGVIAFLLLASTAESVELTILTPTGHITFSAPDEWSVISSQTKMPVAVMAFQIVDPFDEATSDSTNVAVNFYDDNTSEGREAIKNVGKRYGPSSRKHRASGNGTCSTSGRSRMARHTQFSMLAAELQTLRFRFGSLGPICRRIRRAMTARCEKCSRDCLHHSVANSDPTSLSQARLRGVPTREAPNSTLHRTRPRRLPPRERYTSRRAGPRR